MTDRQAQVLGGRLGAYIVHSRYSGQAITEKARAAFNDWEKKADPEGVLSPEERARRGDMLRKAHFARMALRSAQARRRPKDAA